MWFDLTILLYYFGAWIDFLGIYPLQKRWGFMPHSLFQKSQKNEYERNENAEVDE